MPHLTVFKHPFVHDLTEPNGKKAPPMSSGRSTMSIVLSRYLGGHDQRFWNRHLRHMLERMLFLAGYCDQDVSSQLRFLESIVTPHLGKRPRRIGRHAHHSFMTDDGTPIEMSWSWTEGDIDTMPVVRYSIEPLAMTLPKDEKWLNLHGSNAFLQDASGWFTAPDMTWFNRVNNILLQYDRCPIGSKTGEHESQIFWAFDLDGGHRLLKVYYVLNARAQGLSCSKLSLVERAVSKLSVDESMATALENFFTFIRASGADTEVEILSFDCIDPDRSRIKIYFRSRITSFSRVRSIMSWGQMHSCTTKGDMGSLKDLWHSVLGLDSHRSLEDPLQVKKHRTAGILYYCEFKPRTSAIKSKVYIPVRHYGINDQLIASRMSHFLTSRSMRLQEKTYLEALQQLQ